MIFQYLFTNSQKKRIELIGFDLILLDYRLGDMFGDSVAHG